MFPDDTRNKIENITTGVIIEGPLDNCTTIRNLLCASFATSTTVKKDFEGKSIIKEKQVQRLEEYCTKHNLWVTVDTAMYLTRGGEAKVYLADDRKSVIKLNDGIYYATWLEFFNSLMLHNLIFPDTGYELLGFFEEAAVLFAVLKQPFITINTRAELSDIQKHLQFNGFTHSRRNDYIHQELGLILEDMHDENVILKDGSLFFIDTVFYVTNS